MSYDTLKQLIDKKSISKNKWTTDVQKIGTKLIRTLLKRVDANGKRRKASYFIMAHALLGVTWPDLRLRKRMRKEKYENSTLYEKMKWGSYLQMGKNLLSD